MRVKPMVGSFNRSIIENQRIQSLILYAAWSLQTPQQVEITDLAVNSTGKAAKPLHDSTEEFLWLF